jgi:beta-galactosidase
LIADRRKIKADGKDLSFIKVRVLDKDDNPVPDADNLIHFNIAGNGTIAATDNGYQASLESFQKPERKCWKGLALVIVKSTEKKGNITLKASAEGLEPAILSLQTAD